MQVKWVVAVAMFVSSQSLLAAEYCLDRYNDQIRQVDAQAADKLNRLKVVEEQLINIRKDKDNSSKEMADIVRRDPKLQLPANQKRMKHLADQYDGLDKAEEAAKKEGFKLQDEIVARKKNIPDQLAAQLRGCVEATAPANTAVNLVIQVIAALSTGGASLVLPPKALYVDMSAVLNGYPLGGPQSVVNQARESVLNALGIGGENNDLGRIIRDPGRIIRCWFGC